MELAPDKKPEVIGYDASVESTAGAVAVASTYSDDLEGLGQIGFGD